MVNELEIFDKTGATTRRTHSMYGQLRMSRNGWLQLQVPNALGRGVFDTLQEPGIELPVSQTTGQYNAHVSIMSPEEVEAIGGPDRINERGHSFAYSIGELYSVEPLGWKDVSKVWCLRVYSPELQALRRTYGLPPTQLAEDGEAIPFHLTVGIRKRGVLGINATAKENTWGTRPVEAPPKPIYDVEDGESKQVKFGSALVKALTREGKRINTEPTAAQIEAGNYQKGHVRMHGLDITIENPKGSVRSGTAPDGKKWSVTMRAHYGYIRGTVGRDEDHVDCFVGDDPDTELVFVIDQLNPDTGRFDEHKTVFGCKTQEEAKALYLANYAKGWQGCGSITGLTISQFKEWLQDGDTTKPLAESTFQLKTAAAVGLVLTHGKAIRLVMPV